MTISEIGFLKSGIFVADKIGYMELDQYNFKQFQDGLTDILNKPWKEPVFIQDAIPTFPEVNDEDRPVHNLIMLQFIDERLLRPYYSTVGYLLLNKAYFLKYILETYSTKADFVAMFEGSSRLTFNEIYEAFNGMGPTNASFLLDRIDCPVSVYTRLKESLERKEEAKFAEAIDECDISNILPALKYILFIKQQVKKLDSPDPQGKEGTNMDFETAKQKLLYELETDMTEKHGISPNSPLKQDIMGYYDELFSLMYNPNELLESFYPPLFCQYCQMKKGGGLNDSDVKAFEYIFHQPAFEEQYERCLQLWETGELEGMFSKQSEEDSLNEDGGKEAVDSVAANKKEQQSTQQIEELDKEEGHLYPDSKYEFVPENYFEPGCISKGYIEEHYELVDRVKKHGLQAFVDFINFIAKEGFIENEDEIKALLAYRLTGRMRPEKLEKIIWFKEKSEPKELYYVIKYFSPRSGKKFSKQMKEYFENDYFGVENYSRTAEDVSDDFKDKLEGFFPGLTNTSKG